MSRMLSYPDGCPPEAMAMIDADGRLADGCMIEGYVLIVSFVEPDGGHSWSVRECCDMPVSSVVGLLEMSKLQMLAITPGAVDRLSPDD